MSKSAYAKIDSVQEEPQNSLLVDSLCIEIFLSQIALTVVVFPLVALVIPTLLVVVGLTSIAGVGGVFAGLTTLVEHSGFSWAIGFLILCSGGTIYTRSLLCKDTEIQWKQRSRLLPTSWGEAIGTRVREIWSDLKQTETVPEVYWFPALDIAAYAVDKNGHQIHISAALAQALLRGDAMASAIIAHEMGHFAHRDLLHFRHLQAMVSAASFSQWIIVSVGVLAITGYLIKNAYQQFSSLSSLTHIISEQVAILFVGFNWYFVFAILGWLAVSRHAALVTALIEIRADMVAANWTGGLERFTQAFVSAKSSMRSGKHDRLMSLLSPRLTHLPKEERLSLMQSSAAIAVPKLKYYLASIALASLLPLNFFVPLMFGGTVSHVASLTLALLIQFLVVIMLMVAPNTALSSISVKRLLLISIIVIVSLGLTRLNIEPISYLFVSWFAGFGGEPMDWMLLLSDLSTTVKDLVNRAYIALLNPGSLMAAFITFSVITRYCYNVAPGVNEHSGRWHYTVVLSVLIVFTLLASYDQYRVEYWPEWLSTYSERIYAKLGDWASILQSLPVCAALLVHELFLHVRYISAASDQLTNPSSGRSKNPRR